ncbi:hypothetical protein [Streptomyces sp. NPDC059631]|uniref:hypothetical protein n=1 Tax=unclassified Streptomyces TaxID=2593676 RepID=UPI0036A40877
MAATVSIPLYLTIGTGTSTEIGTIDLAVDSDGRCTLTTFDIAAALREVADAIEAPADEEVRTDAAAR